MFKYKEIEECLCCGNDELRKVFDLGHQPLANNSLLKKDDLEEKYPLKLNFCNKCTHLQLKHAVDPDLMFKQYLYMTGIGQTVTDYCKWFVYFTDSYFKDDSNNRKVLDIACNDGTLLNHYMSNGYETFGIDPSENLYKMSSQHHHVICDYLKFEQSMMWHKRFSTIVAQNVIAHNSYPLEFLQIAKDMLTDDGYLFIQNSQANMLENGEFDTIYHEHISFYSIKSFQTLVKRAGLYLVDCVRHPIHGMSYIFVLSKDPEKAKKDPDWYDFERTDESIDAYVKHARWIMHNFAFMVHAIRKQEYRVVGYGAAAKGNTLLNASNVHLDYIVDETPMKQGRFTPGMRIPIVAPDRLEKETGKVCVIPLAWNLFDELKQKSLSRLQGAEDIVFVRYFPNFELEHIH